MRSSRRRLPLALRLLTVLALLLAAAPLAARPVAAANAPAAALPANVDSKVRQQVAGNGKATVIAVLRERADLRPAATFSQRAERTGFVHQQLNATADRSQASLRGLLRSRGASFQPYWIVNAVLVRDADADLVAEVASRPEVERVLPNQRRETPDPKPSKARAEVAEGFPWNIERIRAPEAWATGARGAGITVAAMDGGAQFDHPALVRQYRGNRGGGAFDHNYNWKSFANTDVCPIEANVPCDETGHGTHVLGTMVGDDGADVHTGVAPDSKWIAVKHCGWGFCFDDWTIQSAQWLLAPTDLNGNNPRPDLAPNVINNSWGTFFNGGEPLYQQIVNNWVAAGIFPAFANGNDGPACGSVVSPGDYLNTYGVGAFNFSNEIAPFSGRGPSAFSNETKPDIAAPGVDIFSTLPGSFYGSMSGTSMATPHVAGAVAVLWSAAPGLVGAIDETRGLLDQSAIDTSDLTCGGTAGDNNVWGEGRLDLAAAAQLAPRAPAGVLRGTITDSTSAQPIRNATVRVTGASTRRTTTAANGTYSLHLVPGSYSVTVTAFGYSQRSSSVTVTANQTTTRNLTLARLARHPVSGQVRDNSGAILPGVEVTFRNAPIAGAVTDATGTYRFASVPVGTYDLALDAGRCVQPGTRQVVVDGPETVNVTLTRRADSFGYTCREVTPDYVAGTNVLPLTGQDESLQAQLPFQFRFYGTTQTSVWVSTNGFLNFLEARPEFVNRPLPSAQPPNGAIYPFWDDLFVDGSAGDIRTATVGTAPNRRFVVEWREAEIFGFPNLRLTFEAVLHENGTITFQYNGVPGNKNAMGGSATIGIENHAGTTALQYSDSDFRAIPHNTLFAVQFRGP